jgi:zinc/manganese transport system substrate-binding protein
MKTILAARTLPVFPFPAAFLARLIVLALALAVAGCRSSPPATGSAPSGPRPRVVTTVLPITLFTRAVAEGCAEVEPLVAGGGDPHDHQASPSQLARLRGADVLVINGLGLEAFLRQAVQAAGNPRLRVIDASRGIVPLASSAPEGAEEGHAHGDGEADAHGSEPVNPHVWLDPRRAARQVENIREGMIAADPGCRATYTANAAAFLAELRALDAELEERLAPHAGRGFVAFHDTAPYFADRYGLRAHFLVRLPEESPSASDLRRVAGVVREAGLQALLTEPGAPDRTLAALSRDLGVGLAVFDPLESGAGEAAQRPEHYGATLRRNTEALLAAFASEGRTEGGGRQ